MKFSVNWLREFVELPSTVEELANVLTLAGIEIEGTDKRGVNFDKVIVAQIVTSAQHPNADRLSVCEVDAGTGQAYRIVCGAKNYKVGDKVPLALPGAVLANDLRIKISKLRGVESEGMLCSGKELGLSEDSAGLLILGSEAKTGTPIGFLFPEDTVLDVEITPNRADLLSHFGLAREIAALTGASHRDTFAEANSASVAPKSEGVSISASSDCPFYSARPIRNVAVGPSPEWLRMRLETVGQRSINNIVDITNFVMLEMGQPLHAFDADQLRGGINVRHAHKDEKFLALDGKTYSLGESDLVIADDARVVGIAGVMGGEDTGVTNRTKNVLLESAYFRPGSIRQTARRLSLPSDSSYRFERGVDPAMVLRASQRATKLISELAAGSPSPEIALAGQIPPPPGDVSLRYDRCNRSIGVQIPPQRIDQILERFGFAKVKSGEDSSSWRVPSFRSDIQREADLIEEVVRVFGIDQIPVKNVSRFTPASEADRAYDLESTVRQRLIALELFEARTSALIPRSSNPFEKDALELRNPLSEDHVALRPTLFAGLLTVIERNIRGGASSIRVFELGNVFGPERNENRHLALAFCGTTETKSHWRQTKRQLDFFDLKGVIEAIGIKNLAFRRSEQPALVLSADVFSGSNRIGFLGQLAASQAEITGATAPILLAEIEMKAEFLAHRQTSQFQEIEKFPAISRDIAMIVPEKLSHGEIMDCLESAREPLLSRIELFDLFSGREAVGLGGGKKSLAYTLTYRDKFRTLTSDEINQVHTKIRERLQRELGVELRE